MDTRELVNIFNRRLSLNELHSLAWDMGWNREDIGTNYTVKSVFTRELICKAERHGFLDRLMQFAANANPVLVFDGTVLYEKGGAIFEPIESDPMPPDPRETRKQEILAALAQRSRESLFDALAYLIENL